MGEPRKIVNPELEEIADSKAFELLVQDAVEKQAAALVARYKPFIFVIVTLLLILIGWWGFELVSLNSDFRAAQKKIDETVAKAQIAAATANIDPAMRC